MSYLNNTKLRFLLAQFKNISKSHLDVYLNKIQITNVKTLDASFAKKNTLEELFYSVQLNDKIPELSSTPTYSFEVPKKTDITIVEKKDKKESNHKVTNPKVEVSNTIVNNCNLKIVDNFLEKQIEMVSNEKSFIKKVSEKISNEKVSSEKVSINNSSNKDEIKVNNINSIFKKNSGIENNDTIKELSEKYIILSYHKKHYDVYSNIILDVLSNEFYVMNKEDKKKELVQFKLDLASYFNIQNLFRECCFMKGSGIKKSDIDLVFGQNKEVSLNMLPVYGVTLDINIIYNKDNEYNYITPYIKNRATILIIETEDKIYSIRSKNIPIRGCELESIFKIKKVYSKDNLEKEKIEKIQNIANSLNINLKKEGKTGRVNLKKEDLIDLIVSYKQ